MVNPQLHFNMVMTEVGKIAIRIHYLRHVTFRLVQPSVTNNLEDRADLCASLHSLNQTIDLFDDHLKGVLESLEALKQRQSELKNSDAPKSVLQRESLANDFRQVALTASDLRLQLNTVLLSADAILHLFTEETSL
jgi:hypothetical protein